MDRWQRIEDLATIALMILCLAAVLALPNILTR